MLEDILEWLELEDSRYECERIGAPIDECPDEVPEVLKKAFAEFSTFSSERTILS